MSSTVPELDILLGVARWLVGRGAMPRTISLAAGSAAGKYADRQRLEAGLAALGLPPDSWHRSSDGPDIVALGRGELWLVECKGAGAGTSQTQRNNFDRALASAVSYYGYTPYGVNGPEVKRRMIALGLAATTNYTRELKRRVRRELRTRLDMWVFLLDPSTVELSAIAPDSEYSF
jgi:hypothetical protein